MTTLANNVQTQTDKPLPDISNAVRLPALLLDVFEPREWSIVDEKTGELKQGTSFKVEVKVGTGGRSGRMNIHPEVHLKLKDAFKRSADSGKPFLEVQAFCTQSYDKERESISFRLVHVDLVPAPQPQQGSK